LAPLQPLLAVHVVALLVDQVRVEDPPVTTVVGLALKLTTGAPGGGGGGGGGGAEPVTVTLITPEQVDPPALVAKSPILDVPGDLPYTGVVKVLVCP
jgi:hypothetical protein